MARKLIEEYKKWELEVNITKTECMTVGGPQENIVLEDGSVIKNCDKYKKYLGLKITNDGKLDEGIKDRIMQGRRAISVLNGVLRDQGISKANKKNIYNTVVKSIITYGSEVWREKQNRENMLSATEMDYWRRSAGKTKREQITNNRVREIMGAEHTIVDDIRTKQLIWFGHVQRMPDHRIPKQILL
ncbi:uncharacterized protein LOC115888880 [Sitophilus oryzae]|uniref:Uncharacterized protein LOC115888880 n=1 Tax=Sitophilus oryzae TaxID=7048 RepID=A0A6J2YMI2_SITOR|nr:uncharacterized protein LOC115888880 [Sitophilus oryzae]